MPMYVAQRRPDTEQRDAICIPLQLTEWSEYDGVTAAIGKRLDKGHEGEQIGVVLTTRDKHSKNKKRKSLDEWRDGFMALGQSFKLEVGGIISFKNCRPINNGVWVAAWTNVLAQDADQIENIAKADNAVMRVSVGQDGSGWGDVVNFYPEAAVDCGTDAEVREHACRLAMQDGITNPVFILRGVNSAGEVVAATEITAKRKKQQVEGGQESYVAPTPHEIGELAQAYATELAKLSDTVVRFNLMPGDRFIISPRTMSDSNKVDAMVAAGKAFREKQNLADEIYVAKEVMLKLSAPSEETDGARFINGVYPVHPFGRGKNPDLLGGFVYAKNAILEPVYVDPSSLQGQSQEQSQSHQARGEREAARAQAPNGSRNGHEPAGVPSLGLGGTRTGAPKAPPAQGAQEDAFAGIPSVTRQRMRP